MENPVAVSSPEVSFARLACVIRLTALQAEVESLLHLSQVAETWVDHVNKNDYRGGWDVLPLRCQRQHLSAHPILQGFAIANGDDWENLPVLDQCPAIAAIFNQLQCPIKAARLMRLKAGAEIKPHRDQGLSIAYGEARLHVPIYTSADVSFIVDNKIVPMDAGELWYFNADQTHEVYNYGSEDRINLVIDCVANNWLCNAIATGVPNA
ncbi:Aspartyl/Asparaginyl beta-hydroxylase family [Cellvibrio sp. BR]|uniref:aspartyl/asparaginyl beta-hydroxylase domain-containing protein n=1 Tax=Cellvibrio sp. BR TaxID=1134474 RepID=UPI0002600D0F|nr:aspartyl/asparaginyl beta-hydroxylase domain-containing protein [Cellvibrio sp. BR]EIK44579.1 Aspartyl/Asparaginyl beta-hydroxylase family [Cellvibrio sp. BR]